MIRYIVQGAVCLVIGTVAGAGYAVGYFDTTAALIALVAIPLGAEMLRGCARRDP